MAYKDYSIDINHLKNAELTAGDFHDIVTVLEGVAGRPVYLA
jgi:hypothetical protein